MKGLFLTTLLLFCSTLIVQSQNPQRFEADIEKFAKIEVPGSKDLVVFTGSSSIRFWEDLEKDCHSDNVINTGFGGSHMSDLLYYIDQTVLRFDPLKVYIYEGDNDIAAEKTPTSILNTTKKVVEKIKANNSNVKIYLISAKPSPSRWEFKKGYEELNNLLREYSETKDGVFYIDIWNAMLDKKGNPNANIFIADSLHMNREGYLIWRDIICSEPKK